MGLFSCCFESRKTTEKSEADTRHARIVEIYRQAEVESQQITQAPPPAYQDIVYDTFTGTTIVVNEKSSQNPAQPQPEPTAQNPISRPASPQTSIYSVPSTRLTDITSAYTGTTAVALTHQGDSPRSSMVFDSAPPSYYDGRSIRERSRSPAHNRGAEAESQHPVMADEWLDRMIQDVQARRHASQNQRI